MASEAQYADSPAQPASEGHLKGEIHFLAEARQPVLEIRDHSGFTRWLPFNRVGPGRHSGEEHWQARPYLAPEGDWQFRIDIGGGQYDHPLGSDFYRTSLRRLWIQDQQVFSYKPAATVRVSRVLKIPRFKGRLRRRPLYIYLPRGYHQHAHRHYPILYMQDGQNCFQAFAEDSYAGSWRADVTADLLINQGRMRECIIVGVSNGGKRRMAEYLPPYITFSPRPEKARQDAEIPRQKKPIPGRADRTSFYYRKDIDSYLHRNYRVLVGRENRATCGSSLGGLFSAYMAWEHPEFARHHALLSASFWATLNQEGSLETIERFRVLKRRDVRLWLDSGTINDGMQATTQARDALLENGFEEGPNFKYYLHQGAAHNEEAWAERLEMVFQFLYPLS